MKWIGQHIWDLTSRFRNDIYFEGLAETAETRGLVVDANGKVSINPLSGDEHATHVYENVRNDEGATIPVGTPVYSKGEIGGSERIKVGIADASDPAKMPAIGITNTELTTTGDTKDGLITLVGVYNTNLSGFSGVSENDIVYVASGGGLTITKPTGVNLIQNVGIVLKTNGPGTIIQGLAVTCIGRTNDVPTPLYIDHANQRVGIGTSNPLKFLHLESTEPLMRFDDTNSGLHYIVGQDGDEFKFTTNNPTYGKYTFDSNVGIGTASPSQKLHVIGDARIQGNLTVNGTYTQIDTDVNTTEQWLVTNDGTGPAAVINQLGTEDIFDVQDDGTSVFYIEDGGNVGIGTTSPEAKLHVYGTSNPVFKVEDDGGAWGFVQAAGSNQVYVGSGPSANLSIYAGLSSAMTILASNRNVGIGNTNPGYKLDVSSGSAVGARISTSGFSNLDLVSSRASGNLGGIRFKQDVDTYQTGEFLGLHGGGFEWKTGNGAALPSTRMILNTSGNVGIGTDSPGAKLEVNSGGGIHISDDATGRTLIVKPSLSGSVHEFTSDNTAAGYAFSNNSFEFMRIAASGNVGIGTSSPSHTLDVDGGAQFNTNTGATPFYITRLGSTDQALSIKVMDDNVRFESIQDESADNYGGFDFRMDGGTTEPDFIVRKNAGDPILNVKGNGNVGIGTASPSDKLDVAGDIKVSNTYGTVKIIGTGGLSRVLLGDTADDDVGYLEYNHINNYFRVGVNASERMRIDSSGNIGIGTTSPYGKLHVLDSATGAVGMTVHNNLEATGNSAALWFKVAGSTADYRKGAVLFVNNGTGYGRGDFYFASNTSISSTSIASTSDAKMIIKGDTGNVGIGTTSPSKELHIKSYAPRLLIEGTGASAENEEISRVSGLWDGTYVADIQFLAGDDTSNKDNGKIAFRTYTSDGAVGTRMLIDEVGNVGIGTTSPASKLHINGTGSPSIIIQDSDGTDQYATINHNNGANQYIARNNTSNGQHVWFGQTGVSSFTERMRIDASGNVGIGTTSPGYKLDVNGSVNTAFGATNGYRINTNRVLSQLSGGVEIGVLDYKTIYPNISFNNDNTFRVQQNGSTKVIVNSSGNVGIGTTSPNEKLEVDGNIRLANSGKLYLWQTHDANYLQYYRWELNSSLTAYINNAGSGGVALKTAGNTRLHIDNSGNVGIGTTSPQADLQVGSVTASFYSLSTGKADFIDTDKVLSETQMGTLNVTSNSRSVGDNSDLGPSITFSQNVSQYVDGYEKVIGGIKSYITTSGNTGENSSLGFYTHNGSSLSERLTINSSGNVGIGTSSPTEKLHVEGRLRLGTTPVIASHDTITIDIDQNNNQADNYFRVTKDGEATELFRVQEDGNVGIGTASPSYKLDVNGGGVRLSSSNFHVYYGSYTGSWARGYLIQNSDASDQYGITGEFDNDSFEGLRIGKYVYDNKGIFIEKDGNVGIGTSSPSYKLDVNGGGVKTTTATGNRIAYYDGSGINAYGGSSGYGIRNYHGDLSIIQHTNDADIVFQSDDGSGGVETYFFLDGSEGVVNFPDNKRLTFGTGRDLFLYHDGTNATFKNYVGDIVIQNEANDKDIIFKSDDGSGGVTAYLTLDGSASRTKFAVDTFHSDGVAARFGNGEDLRIYHNGSHSNIESNGVGDLYIMQKNDDSDIIFQSDDGSGGVATYFRLDGSVGMTVFPDAKKLSFGNSFDLKLEHDGSNSYLSHEGTGNLIVRNTTDDGDIIFQSDDGSGGVTTYLTLDGGLGHTTIDKRLRANDNVDFAVGTGNDLRLVHDGTHSYMTNYTGDFYIANHSDDKDIIFQSDDGSGGLATYFFLDGSNSHTNFQLNARWVDNAQAQFGNSGDLLVYHDGSNSYIKDGGTGSLYTLTNAYRLTNAAGNENMIWAEENSFVKLYHNNSAKLETTSTGVEVTGNISLTGSVQRQISTTHHTFTTVNGGSAAQDYWVPFIGTNELAAPNVTHRTIAPYGGILKKAIVHSTAAFGTSAQVRFHRIDNGTASVFTNDNSTDDVTTNVTRSLATAYTSSEFIFTTGNTFSAGDQIGVSFVRDNTAQGDVAMTLVWEYELF